MNPEDHEHFARPDDPPPERDHEPHYDRDELDLGLFFASIPPSWQCPHCGKRSYSHHDMTNQYCAHCHHFCEDVPLQK